MHAISGTPRKQMKAAILSEMGRSRPYVNSKPLVVEDVDLDPPGPGELLIKIKATGLCHSDLSVINGDRPRPMPMILGHEAAGEVVECGAGVTDLKPGDQVVLAFVPSCGSCLPCMEGRPALCEPGARANGAGTLLSGARRLRFHDAPIYHHIGVSGFAEYAVVSRRSAIKVDSSLPAHEAALFGCAIVTGVGAVINTAKVPAGSSVAVVGLGGVGLAALSGREPGWRRGDRCGRHQSAKARGRACVWEQPGRSGLGRMQSKRFAILPEVASILHWRWQVRFRLCNWRSILPNVEVPRLPASLPHPEHRFSIPAVLLAAEERTAERKLPWFLRSGAGHTTIHFSLPAGQTAREQAAERDCIARGIE